jgi:hypothetical protein
MDEEGLIEPRPWGGLEILTVSRCKAVAVAESCYAGNNNPLRLERSGLYGFDRVLLFFRSL